jgi:hypothetical protein
MILARFGTKLKKNCQEDDSVIDERVRSRLGQ